MVARKVWDFVNGREVYELTAQVHPKPGHRAGPRTCKGALSAQGEGIGHV